MWLNGPVLVFPPPPNFKLKATLFEFWPLGGNKTGWKLNIDTKMCHQTVAYLDIHLLESFFNISQVCTMCFGCNSLVQWCRRTQLGEHHCLVRELCLDSAQFPAPGSGATTLPKRLFSIRNKFREFLLPCWCRLLAAQCCLCYGLILIFNGGPKSGHTDGRKI